MMPSAAAAVISAIESFVGGAYENIIRYEKRHTM